MKNELKKIIKTFSNNLLFIGITEDLLEDIDKNNNILNCDILSNDAKENRKGKFFGGKSININKIRKKYKRKSIDYIICNYDVIFPYIRKFVKNSVYINKNKLYFYGNVDLDLIKLRYSRYNTEIDIKKYKNGYIVKVDNIKSKNNFIKELFYSIKDIITFLI